MLPRKRRKSNGKEEGEEVEVQGVGEAGEEEEREEETEDDRLKQEALGAVKFFEKRENNNSGKGG